MKLLLCLYCTDIRKMTRTLRSCECGRSAARYLDDSWHAEVWGPHARVVLMYNGTVLDAIQAAEHDPTEREERDDVMKGCRITAALATPSHPRITWHREEYANAL